MGSSTGWSSISKQLAGVSPASPSLASRRGSDDFTDSGLTFHMPSAASLPSAAPLELTESDAADSARPVHVWNKVLTQEQSRVMFDLLVNKAHILPKMLDRAGHRALLASKSDLWNRRYTDQAYLCDHIRLQEHMADSEHRAYYEALTAFRQEVARIQSFTNGLYAISDADWPLVHFVDQYRYRDCWGDFGTRMWTASQNAMDAHYKAFHPKRAAGDLRPPAPPQFQPLFTHSDALRGLGAPAGFTCSRGWPHHSGVDEFHWQHIHEGQALTVRSRGPGRNEQPLVFRQDGKVCHIHVHVFKGAPSYPSQNFHPLPALDRLEERLASKDPSRINYTEVAFAFGRLGLTIEDLAQLIESPGEEAKLAVVKRAREKAATIDLPPPTPLSGWELVRTRDERWSNGRSVLAELRNGDSVVREIYPAEEATLRSLDVSGFVEVSKLEKFHNVSGKNTVLAGEAWCLLVLDLELLWSEDKTRCRLVRKSAPSDRTAAIASVPTCIDKPSAMPLGDWEIVTVRPTATTPGFEGAPDARPTHTLRQGHAQFPIDDLVAKLLRLLNTDQPVARADLEGKLGDRLDRAIGGVLDVCEKLGLKLVCPDDRKSAYRLVRLEALAGEAYVPA